MAEKIKQRYYVWKRDDENGDYKVGSYAGDEGYENAKAWIAEQGDNSIMFYITAKYDDLSVETYKPFN